MREHSAIEFVELMSPFKPKGQEGVAVCGSGEGDGIVLSGFEMLEMASGAAPPALGGRLCASGLSASTNFKDEISLAEIEVT